MIDLKGKSILFISPSFFGYEESIKNRLQELGASVDYFDERPANSFWIKAFIRLNRKILSYSIKRYYYSIYQKIYNNIYDYIFVINVEAMPYSFLKDLRKQNPSAKFVLYMWDSIRNKKNSISYLPYFNSVLSFDKSDCEEFSQIKFRPLFFLNEYQTLASDTQFEYVISFVGTAHSDRFLLIRNIQKYVQNKHLKTYWYLYLQNRKLFLWNKIYNPAYRKAHCCDFNYRSLQKKEVIDVIRKSKIVLDIQHPRQTGLTMRTIEVLGAARKLITTNTSIQNYDFYKSENILVIDRNNPIIPEDFYNEKYQPIEKDIYYKYSIDGWIDEVFEDL